MKAATLSSSHSATFSEVLTPPLLPLLLLPAPPTCPRRSSSSGASTSAACASARHSAGSREGIVVPSAISWMLSKWCCRWASASWRAVGLGLDGS